jgi:hypothetical protein
MLIRMGSSKDLVAGQMHVFDAAGTKVKGDELLVETMA